MCYILFCSYLPQKKNDRTVIPYSLNPEGPLGSHLCDVIPPALLIKCQFLFYGRERKQDFSQGERNLCVFPFSPLEIIIFILSYVPLSCVSLFILSFVVNQFLVINHCSFVVMSFRNFNDYSSW